MLKGKILLVLALYIALSVIGFFNFGLYHYVNINKRPECEIMVRDEVQEDLDGKVESSQTDDAEEPSGSLSDIEVNN